MSSILSLFRGRDVRKGRKVGRYRSRPAIESLECRQVLSAFAPYVDATNQPDLVNLSTLSGANHFVLDFITADSNKLPSWGGVTTQEMGSSYDKTLLASVASLRTAGGDVMVSFGGQTGTELAQVITNASALEKAYQSVVDEYGLTQIDLDIEGAGETNAATNNLRSAAIAQLQQAELAKGRTLQVWLTLPATPTGLDSTATSVVQSAINAKITNLGVNLMTFDYGGSATPAQMATYAEQAAQNVSHQFLISPSKIGVTPMIGRNDTPAETFDLTSAATVTSWAKSWGLGRLSMWALDRDLPGSGPASEYYSGIAQQDYQFSQTFLGIDGSGSGSPQSVLPSAMATDILGVTEYAFLYEYNIGINQPATASTYLSDRDYYANDLMQRGLQLGLSRSTVDAIEMAATDLALEFADAETGDPTDAATDAANFSIQSQAVTNSGQLTSSLVNNLYGMTYYVNAYEWYTQAGNTASANTALSDAGYYYNMVI